MYKDLLMVDTRAAADPVALNVSLALAAHAGAHLAVLVVTEVPRPLPTEWGAYPATLYSGIDEEVRGRARERATALRTRLEREEVAWEVREVDALALSAPRTAALHARHADLAIVACSPPGENRGPLEGVFVDLLMDGGRPVLLVPEAARMELPLEHAVVAWQPTREATRAVHDALPLLRTARTVDVLVVDPEIDESAHGEQPGADIATHLARHGLKVQVVVRPRGPRSVGQEILAHVRESGAGLLVAGGYSRSRFRQHILGGVTRDLVEAATVPVLFSH